MECWLDILKPEAAAVFPCDDVSLPPRQIFEVRIVIWKAKNVPAMDSLEGMSDLFVKAFLEGSTPHSPNKSILPSFSLFSSSSATSKPLETDTHWRAKKVRERGSNVLYIQMRVIIHKFQCKLFTNLLSS